MRIGNMRFWPSAVAGGFFILRGKRAGAGKNPAVTALPCQGPLGKRVMGEEETDCHDQFANWSRNDRLFARGVVQVRAAGWGAPRSAEGIGVGIFGLKNLM